jgi:hypothetical protein
MSSNNGPEFRSSGRETKDFYIKSSMANSNCATLQNVKSELADTKRPDFRSSEYKKDEFEDKKQQRAGISSCTENTAKDLNDKFLLVGPNSGLLMGAGGALKSMACVDKSQDIKDKGEEKSVKQDIVRREYWGRERWNKWNNDRYGGY